MTHERDRRFVLARLVTAGAALLTAGLAGLVGLVVTPRSNGVTRRWRRVMSVFDLPPDGPTSAVIAERYADGWYETRKRSVVFVDRDGDGYRVLSATCSHLGCSVRWDETDQRFLCPCHGGAYDRTGQVVAGPPPSPLKQFATRVNPDTLDIEVEL